MIVNNQSQPAVFIYLPDVEGFGFVVDRGITKRLKDSIEVILDKAPALHAHTGGDVLGPSLNLNIDDRSLSFVAIPTPETLPWEYFTLSTMS
ncbi:hypothetical protein PG984_016393 [Apiospora sp. TS-2023a]